MGRPQLKRQLQQRKRKMAKAPTWPLPHGEGQGPRPDPDKHLPKQAKGKKVKGKYGKPFNSDIT